MKAMAAYAVCEGVAVVAGYYIRATVVIPVIALIFCTLSLSVCGGVRGRLRQLIVGGVLFMLVSVLLYQGIGACNLAYWGEDLKEQNYPIVHWIAMGTHGDGSLDKNDSVYTMSFPTKEEKQAANLQKIKENIRQLGPAGVAQLFWVKLDTTWADGYNSIHSRVNQPEHFQEISRYIVGDKKDLFVLYCTAYYLLLYLLVGSGCVSYLLSKKREMYLFLLLLTFFGGIAFYSLWEAKNIYSFPFLWFLVLAAEAGGTYLEQNISKKCIKISHGRILTGIYALGLILLGCFLYPLLSAREISCRIDTINVDTPRFAAYVESDAEILQSFSSGGAAFNRIRFLIKQQENVGITQTSSKKNGYTVRLLDEKKHVLRKKFMTSKQIKKETYAEIKFDMVYPEKHQKMYLQIIPKGEVPFVIGYLPREIELYRGDCQVNGNPESYDIWMRVYESGKQVFFSPGVTVLFLIGFGLVAVGLLILFLKVYDARADSHSL